MEDTQVVDTPIEQVAQPEQDKSALVQANMATLRKKLEAEEKARRDAENRAAQLERQAAQWGKRDEDEYEDEDKKKIRQLEARLNAMEVEGVTAKMSDFNELVTDDNLNNLARLYPEEYESLSLNPNVKSRAKMAYNLLKNYGIVDSVNKKNNEKIEANLKKPSAAALGAAQTPSSPLANMDQYGRRVLTDEEKDKVMKDVARRKRMS